MKKLQYLILLPLTFYLASCGVSKNVISLTDVELAKVQANNPDIDDDQLKEISLGKTVYIQNCQTCHALKDPLSRNKEGWNKIVPIMVNKVNEVKTRIDAKGQSQLLAYLTNVCKD